ncbi:MAG: FG-GAP-like repeat-containing protein [Candidatus Moranbacteria bacterium]|nr:FG-GAP-like repeat-containing protein [Candidatus Moranbacteria bacterium]
MSPLTQKSKTLLKLSLIGAFFIITAFFIFFLFRYLNTPDTLNQEIKSFQKGGEQALNDLKTLPSVNLTEEEDSYTIEDILSEGIEITYPNQENKEEDKPKTKVSLPKDYTKPIEIKLDNERIITIEDENNQGYTSDTLQVEKEEKTSFFSQLLKKQEVANTYLRYQNDRKTLLYAYQRDRASGERKLKNFIFYENGTGEEKESYKVANATLKKNENGDVELFYQTEQDLKNQAATKEVDPSLMDRAMRTLEKEGVNQNQNPDLLIPRPYYYDKDGNYQEAEWEVTDNKLILNIKTTKDKYPLSVDPTLTFTAPGISSGGVMIRGVTSTGEFGAGVAVGDLNADGKDDLAVSAPRDGNGKVYIFYNDGSYAVDGANADMIIDLGSPSATGYTLSIEDVSADGKKDLLVGYGSRFYIFYNDGSYPVSGSSADVVMTSASTPFGTSLGFVDYNNDGKKDILLSAMNVSSATGVVYVFYNDGAYPTNVSGADVTLTGESSSSFGTSIGTGDVNADGKEDIIVGAYTYSSQIGRAYIFYNDGSIPTTAATADVIITGNASPNNFGTTIITGDFNTDGRIDLAVSASNAGKVYLFYNDGSIPTTAATADITISGTGFQNFGGGVLSEGGALKAGDFNGDGRTDLLIADSRDAAVSGSAYVFYNDGSYPTTAATADVIITGEGSGNLGIKVAIGDLNADGKSDIIATSGYSLNQGNAYIFYSQNGVLNTNRNIAGETVSGLGSALVAGDFNADGRVDLAVGANLYSSNTGRAYIFYNDGSIPTTAATADVIITGESSSYFGTSLTKGDLNADGKVDLIVGASIYTSNTGRAYIFYNDGSIPTTATTADVIITGESMGNYFGTALTTGDFNADGETDLAATAFLYGGTTGRAYIFYNDGSIPTTAATADVIISGEILSNFGRSINAGDLNADGKIDLAVGGEGYSSSTGRAYIFYNDGSIPTTAATADVIIVGETTNNYFGQYFTIGDLNADGKTDLMVSAYGYSSDTGRAYIFYNDGSIPTTAATADLTITGETAADQFGDALITGDFNADGRIDLAIGADLYSSAAGRAYIFYNDGSIPTTAATADVTINGEGGYFGNAFTVGDFNADGKSDFVIAAAGSSGKVYFYEGQDNYSWTLQQQPLGTTRVSPQVTGEEIRINGEAGGAFGDSFVAGDLNADGKIDLVVGSSEYSSSTGRVYIFYNDGSYPAGSTNADVVITGEGSSNWFGSGLATGDFNTDGKTDLAVGAKHYGASGRVYIFYNDGSYSETGASADVKITAEAGFTYTGITLVSGDVNADGKVDIIAGASLYSSSTGRVYIFYNDGSYPSTTASADVIISGEGGSFGASLVTGDFNADSKVDLAAGANSYNSSYGRSYIFYNDGSIPTTAATADVIIDGSNLIGQFGRNLGAGDLNADGKTDLVAQASGAGNNGEGKIFIFYNDGSIPITSATADVTITGESSNVFLGKGLAIADYNGDGKVDLASGSTGYSTNTGRTYIFYNDGSYPAVSSSADVIMTGESTSNYYGDALIAADFNNDGRADLTVGASGYSSSKGRVYMYTFNDSVTSGDTTNNYFGITLASSDLNADGKTDLAVGASGYSSSTGRAYIFYGGSASDISPSTADVTITGSALQFFGEVLLSADLNTDGKQDLAVGSPGASAGTGVVHIFYNDGSIPTTSATADVTISGSTSVNFGNALTAGDFNADGRVDLAAAGSGYSFSIGRVYVFYNDGSIPTTLATADVIITGNGISSNSFGGAIASGDLNADGKTDLIVADNVNAYIFHNDGSFPTSYSTADVSIALLTVAGIATGDLNADGKTDLVVANSDGVDPGTAWIFYNDGSIPTSYTSADVTITALEVSNFGSAVAAKDVNGDGRIDLVVGAPKPDGSGTGGKVYVFYNDGSYPADTTTPDKVYTDSAVDSFGESLALDDFNFDGIYDIAVGASKYSSNTGRVYSFTTEVAATQVDTKVMDIKGGMNIKGGMTIK